MSTKRETNVNPLRLIRLRNNKANELSVTDMKVKQEISDPNEAVQTFISTDPKSPKAEDNKEDRVVLSNHNNANTDIGRRFQCDKCPEWLSGVNDFITHLETHEDIQPCPYCNGIYNKYEMKRHMRCHRTGMDGSLYVCPLCEKPFKLGLRSKLIQHVKSHDKEKKYVCPECKDRLSNLRSLRRHMHSHFETKFYRCSICKNTYKGLTNFQQHNRREHDPNHKVYTCPECGRLFKREKSMRYHLMRHSGNYAYECDVCWKRLSTPVALRAHRSTHKATTWYQCAKCDKKYRQKTELQNHLLRHEGLLPFKCKDCGAQFPYNQAFQKHVATHTGEMRTTCPICGKVVASPSYLITHLKFHENKREYACNECGKTFNSKNNLTNHSKVHINEKPFKCSYCDHACRYNGNLTKHVRRVHEKKK